MIVISNDTSSSLKPLLYMGREGEGRKEREDGKEEGREGEKGREQEGKEREGRREVRGRRGGREAGREIGGA